MFRIQEAVSLADYQNLSIAFEVTSVYALEPAQDLGFVFQERPVKKPYTKEYDEPGNQPIDWPQSWDLSNWGFLGAYEEQSLLGVAAIAWNTPGVHMLEGRTDLAVLWDIRVHSSQRGKGVGSVLFHAAIAWAKERDIQMLKIETQNINVQACRFYQKMGCKLAAVNTRAYSDLPEEIQLIWLLEL